MITLTREEAQQVLDALNSCEEDWIPDGEWETRVDQYDHKLVAKALEILRTRLSQPENEFNPDWDAMAVMVEEQQRMAKQIEELDIALAEQEWQGLTDEEIGMLTVFDGLHHVEIPLLANFVRAIEAKLKEKNA